MPRPQANPPIQTPHELSLEEFRAKTSLIPLGDNGEVVDYDGRSAAEWMADYEQRVRDLVSRAGVKGRTLDQRVAADRKQMSDYFKREIHSTLSFPVFLLEIDHCVVAFKVSAFAPYKKGFHTGVLDELSIRQSNPFGFATHFTMMGAAGDPVAYTHLEFQTAASKRTMGL